MGDRRVIKNFKGVNMSLNSTLDVKKIVKYENGEMTIGEITTFFQELIDTGVAWKLQGSYGRVANSLIEDGRCTIKPITIDS